MLAGGRAYGWSSAGHQFITDTAMQELPVTLRTFFLNHATAVKTAAGTEPPGQHYIDIDVYPEFAAHTFPHDESVLIARYGSAYVASNGEGPWTAATYRETLQAQMAAARTAADWDALIDTAGALAHCLEDLHNPMHLAENYDGQLTGQTGLHSRYESSLISRRLSASLQLAVNPDACVYYPTMVDGIFHDIDLDYPYNATILAADFAAYNATGNRSGTAYYQHLWDDGCSSFTATVMQQGADMVASGWYSA
jgi:hypothetical protein